MFAVRMLLVALLLHAAVASSGVAPTGKYCASVPGLAQVYVRITDSSHADVGVSIFFQKLSCNAEEFLLDATSGDITLTTLQKPDDCMNKYAHRFGQDISDVNFFYESSANTITVSTSGHSITLTACSGEAIEPTPIDLPRGWAVAGPMPRGQQIHAAVASSGVAPTGKYCASVPGLAQVYVRITDSSHADVGVSIFFQKLSCNAEEFLLGATSGYITLTNLQKPDDCMNKYAHRFGQDISDVNFFYESSANTITVSKSGHSITLTACSGEAIEPMTTAASIIV